MRKKLLYLLFAVVLLSSLILPILPTGMASATDALQEYSTNDPGESVYLIYGNGGANKYAAETFTAGATYELTSIKFKVWITGTPGNASAYIYSVDAAHVPLAVLASGTADTSGWPTTEGTRAFNEIVISPGYVVSAGTEYAVAVSVTGFGGNVTNCINWMRSSAWAGGKGYGWSSGTWDAWSDYLFATYGKVKYPSTATVTAPSSITTTSATLNASLTGMGDNSWVNVYFLYGYTTDYLEVSPSYDYSTTPGNYTSAPQAIAQGITGLLPGYKVYYKIVLDGDVVDFTGTASYFYTSGPPSTVAANNYVNHHGAITHVFQRKGFYASGRYWLIYCKGTNEHPSGGFYWESSVDGLIWTDPYLFKDGFHGSTSWLTNGANEADELNTYFDGTYVHAVYIWNRNDVAYGIGSEVWYRRGIPNSDGTITWSYAWAKAMDYNPATVKGYASVVADTNGYPWIDYWESGSVYTGNDSEYGTPGGLIDRKVIKSSTKDGIFTVAGGYPYTLKAAVASRGTGTLVQLPAGKLYWVGCGASMSPKLVGRLYNGSTWGAEETIDASALGMYRFSVVTRGEVVYVIAVDGDSGDYTTCTSIRYAKLLDTGWTTPVTIISGLTADGTGYLLPAATMTINQATGDLYVFYTDWTNYHIYYKVCPAITGVWSSAIDFVNESWAGIAQDWLSTTIGSYLEVYGGKIGVYYVQGYYDYTIGASTSDHRYLDLKFSYLTVAAGPAIQTDEAADITTVSATLQGYLINNGGNATQVRFDWGTSIAYGSTTTWQSKTTGESFTAAITGLTTNTYYYFKAEAKWADGTTTYGTGRIFLTSSTGPPTVTTNAVVSKTSTGGWLQGTLTTLGDYSTVSVYFNYGLTGAYGNTTASQSKSVIGSYNQFITGLPSNTLIYYRAVVEYGSTPSYAYGSNMTFTTMVASPTLIDTGTAVSITNTSAILQGTLTSLGDYSPVYVYFHYGLTTSYGTSTVEQTRTSTGGYTQAIATLTPNTTYHFRAVVRYAASSYVYGSDGNFTTSTAGLPTVATQSAASVGVSSATLQGSLTGLGDYTTVYVSFEYGLSASYGSATTEQTKTSVTGFTQSLTGLTLSTTYHYRARVRYASASYVNGADTTFTTLAAAPSGGLTVSGANIFRDYDETNDVLVVIEYENTYAPYYPSEDSAKYFWIQLRDTTGTTVIAQTVCPDWGHRPASIYLNVDTAVSIEDGVAYQVFIYGNFAPYPSDEYTLTSPDWVGNDLTFLGRWCLRVAHNMEIYYDIEFTEQTSAKHEVLNEAGGAILDKNIPGLSLKIPGYFSIAKGELALASTDYEDSFSETHLLADKMGPDVVASMTKLGTAFGGMSAQTTVQIVWWILAIGLGLTIAGITHSLMAGGIVGYGTLGVGTFAGAIDVKVVIILAFLAFGYFLWVNVVQKT